MGSCWNGPQHTPRVLYIRLQPLVGSCWNLGARSVRLRPAGASTPRGVLLELGTARVERTRRMASTPRGVLLEHLGEPPTLFERSASTPRGVLLERAGCTALRPSRLRFNPSWGPAGTHDDGLVADRGLASTPRGVLLERRSLTQHPFGQPLQPLVGSCWNAPPSRFGARGSQCFNPSWGPAGTHTD